MNTFLKIGVFGLVLTGAFQFIVFSSTGFEFYQHLPSLMYPVFAAFLIIGIGVKLKVRKDIIEE